METRCTDFEKNAAIRAELERIQEDEPNSIRAYVAEETLYRDDVEMFFQDVVYCGCSGGLIGGLVHYADTHEFFDRFYKEIDEIREEYEDSVGEPIRIKGDMKNFFAWFAFEETAYQIANELGLEI